MNWPAALLDMEADTSATPMDICSSCDAEGGFVIVESADRERWVDCPVCGGSGWADVG